MKKIISSVFLICAAYCQAVEKPYFGYGDVHAMGGYPMIGLGIRTQTGIHAFDVSGNICPLNPPASLSLFHLRGLYLLYPFQTGPYLGGGLGLLNEPETMKGMSGSFECAIGFQWKARIFLQGNATIPFQHSYTKDLAGELRTGPKVWPGLTLGFGF